MEDNSDSLLQIQDGNSNETSGNLSPNPTQPSHTVGKNKLCPGSRGFLVILERGVDKASKLDEVCDLIEKFAPATAVAVPSEEHTPRRTSKSTLNGNVHKRSSVRKLSGNRVLFPASSHQVLGGELYGDGEHNVEDLNSAQFSDKSAAFDDDKDEPSPKNPRQCKSTSSLDDDQPKYEGPLSVFKRPGEAEEDVIKRLAREEMEKYLNDDALLAPPASINSSGSQEGFPRSSLSNCSIPRDESDFSDSVFVPKLTNKPNAILKLELKTVTDPKTQAVYYEHPYKDELDRWTPSPAMLHRSETEWNYRKVTETPMIVVHSPGRLENMSRELRGVKEFAFGVKYSESSYFGSCSLLMISTRYKNYVIDCFNLKKHLEMLNTYFTDPSILKVGHDVIPSLLYLQKDLGLYVVGLMDCNEAEKVIRGTAKTTTLAAILRKYFHYGLDSTYRDLEWNIRPLPKHMIDYARCETHFLLHLYDILKTELLDRGSGEHLCQAFEMSKELCLARYEKPDRDFWVQSYKTKLNNQQFYALHELNALRNSTAKSLDRCPRLLCSDKSLVELAKAMPLQWVQVKTLKIQRKVFLSNAMEKQKVAILRIFEEARMLRLVNPQPQNVKRLVVGQNLKTGVANVVFLRAKGPDHEEVVQSMMKFYKEHVFAIPNFIRRIVPVDTTCEKELPCIRKALHLLLLTKDLDGRTYEIMSNFPYTKQHSLIATVMAVVRAARPHWLYSEDDGDHVDVSIIAHAIRDMCCLSVVKGYRHCGGFYLRHHPLCTAETGSD